MSKYTLKSVIPGVKPMEVLFRFIQPGIFDFPDSVMYDLLEPVGKYPAETTLSRNTLEELGYVFPNDAP